MSDDPDEDEVTPRPTPAELRHHRRTYPNGIPPIRLSDPDDHDDPDDHFPWPIPDRQDAESLRRAGRDPDAPVAPAEISAIVRAMARRMREEFSALLTQVPQNVAEAVNDRIDRLENRMRRQERDFEPFKKLGKWVAGVAFGAVVAIGLFLYHRGQSEQAVTDKLQQLEDSVKRLDRQHEPQFQTGPRP